MQMKSTSLFAMIGLAGLLSACAVVPEPEVEIDDPVVVVPPAPTCYEVASLKRIEIPAETRTVYAVSVIENPPYEPIQQRTEQKIVTKQAEVYYVTVDPETGEETEVTAFCDANIETGPVGPAEGELAGAPTPVE